MNANEKNRIPSVVVVLVAAFAVFGSLVVFAQADGISESAPIDDEALQDAYIARLASNEAPAAATVSADPCPEGTQYWARDSEAALCAPLCGSDADCPSGERCRLLDVASDSTEPVFVDDMTSEELDDAFAEADPAIAPVMLCDPFWETPGATDAFLLAE